MRFYRDLNLQGRRLRIGLLLCLLLAAGCGYRLQGSGSILPPDVRTVYVGPIENETTEPGLSLELAEALRSEFERYGVVSVVDEESMADANLSGKISSLRTNVRSVTGSTDIELQVDLIMTVALELRRRNGQLLWRNRSLNTTETFASAASNVVTSSSAFAQGGIGAESLQGLGDREVSRGQKRQALSDLIEETSRLVYLDAVAADF